MRELRDGEINQFGKIRRRNEEDDPVEYFIQDYDDFCEEQIWG